MQMCFLHAVCDALLGALILGDIGIHFPDTDQSLKDIDSKILLNKTFQLDPSEKDTGLSIWTLLFAWKNPKSCLLLRRCARSLQVFWKLMWMIFRLKPPQPKNLGFIGKEEGIMAQAVVLLRKPD